MLPVQRPWLAWLGRVAASPVICASGPPRLASEPGSALQHRLERGSFARSRRPLAATYRPRAVLEKRCVRAIGSKRCSFSLLHRCITEGAACADCYLDVRGADEASVTATTIASFR
jgi:hypothetical protein